LAARVLYPGTDLGGTWRWNHHFGVRGAR